MGRRSSARRTVGDGDGGFTLVELLVVLAIMPIIVGAIAAVVIGVEDNAGATGRRLADSDNAQISAAYFGSDVEGAQSLTTDAAATSPAVCGSGSTLLLGLLRSAGGTLSVSYWVQSQPGPPGQPNVFTLVRQACNGAGSVTSTAVMSDDVTSTQALAAISPAPFASGAQTGWVATTAATTVTSLVTLPVGTLPVASTGGFSLPGTISVLSGSGLQTLTCTGSTATGFTGCSGGQSTYVVAPGASVTQPAAVTGVQLTVVQPGPALGRKSPYTYQLVAVPRTSSSLVDGTTLGQGPLPSPALLTLGSGVTVQGGKNADLTVDGTIDVNGGTLSCTGGPVVTAYGYEATTGSQAITCGTGGPTTTAALLPDPLAPYLPAYPSSGFPQETVNPSQSSGTCVPGEYTVALSCSTLQPGVYVLDAGLSLSGNASLSMAAGSAGQGVLLYLPCDPPRAPSSCSEGISLGGNTTLALAPLTPAQSQQDTGTSALAGVVVWQAAGDTAPATFGGTPSGISIGTLYLPGAPTTFQGNAGATIGRVIAASVSGAGSTALTITGQ